MKTENLNPKPELVDSELNVEKNNSEVIDNSNENPVDSSGVSNWVYIFIQAI